MGSKLQRVHPADGHFDLLRAILFQAHHHQFQSDRFIQAGRQNPNRCGAGRDVVRIGIQADALAVVPNLEANPKGDGVGLGGNLGITWNITDRQRLAVTYRSPITIDYSGTTEFNNSGGVPDTSFNSQIKFPTIVSVGYGFQVSDTIRLETDVEWVQFSRFKKFAGHCGAKSAGRPRRKTSLKTGAIPSRWASVAIGSLPTIGFCAAAINTTKAPCRTRPSRRRFRCQPKCHHLRPRLPEPASLG